MLLVFCFPQDKSARCDMACKIKIPATLVFLGSSVLMALAIFQALPATAKSSPTQMTCCTQMQTPALAGKATLNSTRVFTGTSVVDDSVQIRAHWLHGQRALAAHHDTAGEW